VTLAQARRNIGAEVIYRPCDLCALGTERGTITSVSNSQVFVQNAGGTKATRPGDLTLSARRNPAVPS